MRQEIFEKKNLHFFNFRFAKFNFFNFYFFFKFLFSEFFQKVILFFIFLKITKNIYYLLGRILLEHNTNKGPFEDLFDWLDEIRFVIEWTFLTWITRNFVRNDDFRDGCWQPEGLLPGAPISNWGRQHFWNFEHFGWC